jgi:hypothetical protein
MEFHFILNITYLVGNGNNFRFGQFPRVNDPTQGLRQERVDRTIGIEFHGSILFHPTPVTSESGTEIAHLRPVYCYLRIQEIGALFLNEVQSPSSVKAIHCWQLQILQIVKNLAF